MHGLSILLIIAGLYMVAVASPGPNFLLVTQLALGGSRARGAQAALGVAVGSTIWAVLAMAGVAAVLGRLGWIAALVRIGGALYLVWFGAKLLLGAWRGGEGAATLRAVPPTGWRAFRAGLATNLTNPKAGAFWTSIFGSVFPAHAPAWLFAATGSMIAAVSLGWHLGLAWLFASPPVQRRYRRLRRGIDAACGTLLIGFGALLGAGR